MQKALIITTLALLVLAFNSTAAPAQVSSDLERLEIVFWPEYDQPSVLVMMRGWLPPDAHLPTYVPLPLPAGTQPSAVAKRDAAGRLLNAAYTVIDHGAWQEVRLAADTREVRVEYYAPLSREDSARSHTFRWPGPVGAGSITWEVQQPVGAAGLATTPVQHEIRAGFDGLTYFSGDLGGFSPGESFEIGFRYVKATPSLTISSMQPNQPQLPPPAPTSETPSTQSTEGRPTSGGGLSWPILIPVLLLGFLIVGWFLHSGSKT